MLTEMDMKVLWKELDGFDEELCMEKAKLATIRQNMEDLKAILQEDDARLRERPEFDFLPTYEIIYFNIGGQLFDVPVSILSKDPSSVLAICCRVSNHFIKDKAGRYFFDRDWWIFRLILSFLRSKVLPSDKEVLKELYREAVFYRLSDLIYALESLSKP